MASRATSVGLQDVSRLLACQSGNSLRATTEDIAYRGSLRSVGFQKPSPCQLKNITVRLYHSIGTVRVPRIQLLILKRTVPSYQSGTRVRVLYVRTVLYRTVPLVPAPTTHHHQQEGSGIQEGSRRILDPGSRRDPPCHHPPLVHHLACWCQHIRVTATCGTLLPIP